MIGVLAMGRIVGCPIYQTLGVPCPCCGITRAWIALFEGNLFAALTYNPLFIFITVALVAFVFEEKLFLKPKIKNVFFVLSGVVIFLSYLVRLGQGTLPV